MEDIRIIINYYQRNYKYVKKLFEFFLNFIEVNEDEIETDFLLILENKKGIDELFGKKIVVESKSTKEIILYENQRIYISLNKEKYLQNSEKIDDFISKLFIETKGAIAVLKDKQYSIIQNMEDIDYFERRGIKVDESKIIEEDGEKIIDITKNAGSTTKEKGIEIGVYWKMWIGHDYYNWLSKEDLSNFNNCYENIEMEDGSRKIVMTRTLEEFISSGTDDMKWDFKKKMNLEQVKETIRNLPEEKYPKEYMEFDSFRIKDMYYSIKYFDDDMQPIRRKDATKYRLIKFWIDEKVGIRDFEKELIEKIGWLKDLDLEKLYKGEI